MKSLMPGVIALFTAGVLIASALPALAQPGSKPRGQMAAAPATEVSTARGLVKSVSATRLELEIPQGGSGADTLALDDRTVFQRLGKTLSVKDLKPGDPVTVSYTMKEGKAVATRVWVRFAGAGGASGGSKAR